MSDKVVFLGFSHCLTNTLTLKDVSTQLAASRVFHCRCTCYHHFEDDGVFVVDRVCAWEALLHQAVPPGRVDETVQSLGVFHERVDVEDRVHHTHLILVLSTKTKSLFFRYAVDWILFVVEILNPLHVAFHLV